MLPAASACSSCCLSLTSQVDLINTEKIDSVKYYAGFVNCMVAIPSQRLAIRAYYNALPGLSNLLLEHLWQILSRLDIEIIFTHFTISFALAVCIERTD